MKYDAFISYSWKDYKDENGCLIDGNIISKITKALSENGLTYWIDEEGISVGEEFPELIYDNIMNSGCMIFISSHNSNYVSKWTSKEISLAIEHKKLIIPVICDNSKFKKGINLLLSDVDKFDMTKNPSQQITEIIEAVKENRDKLLDEIKQAEEEVERKKAVTAALVTLEMLEKNRSKLRKELSRIRGEYDSISKDFNLNQNKISETVKILENAGQTFDRMLLESADDGVTFDDMLERFRNSESTIAELNKKIEELTTENNRLTSEIERLRASNPNNPEGKKEHPSLKWVILLLIVGIAVGFVCGYLSNNYHSEPAVYPDGDTACIEEVVCVDESATNFHTSGFVDMGTSKLWASINFGATNPDEVGKLITWPDIQMELEGTDESLPTISDFIQLKNRCRWEKGKYNGVSGFFVTSDSTNNQIFLPTTSFLSYDDKHYVTKSPDWGVYWTSTIFDEKIPDDSKINIFTFGMSSEQPVSDKKFRNAKCAARLVKEK